MLTANALMFRLVIISHDYSFAVKTFWYLNNSLYKTLAEFIFVALSEYENIMMTKLSRFKLIDTV